MRLLAVPALFVLVAGTLACAGAPAPVDRHFRLEGMSAGAVLDRPGLAGTLIVERPRGDALLAQRPIVYRRHADTPELGQYPYALWVDAPTTLVQQGMAEHLAAAGLASQVLTSEAGPDGDYVLRGRLLRLEHVLTGTPGVAVELELFLIHHDSDSLMLTGRYRGGRPVADGELTSVVGAFGGALRDALDAFVVELGERGATDGQVPIPANAAP